MVTPASLPFESYPTPERSSSSSIGLRSDFSPFLLHHRIYLINYLLFLRLFKPLGLRCFVFHSCLGDFSRALGFLMGDSRRHEPWVSLQPDGWLRRPALGLNSLMQIPDKIQNSLKVGLSKGKDLGVRNWSCRCEFVVAYILQ